MLMQKMEVLEEVVQQQTLVVGMVVMVLETHHLQLPLKELMGVKAIMVVMVLAVVAVQ